MQTHSTDAHLTGDSGKTDSSLLLPFSHFLAHSHSVSLSNCIGCFLKIFSINLSLNIDTKNIL
jgi:hypothetical protein